MVRAELTLNPVWRGSILSDGHDASVVDEDVNPIDAIVDLRCSFADGGLVAEIEFDELDLHVGVDLVKFLDHRCNLGFVATGKNDLFGVGFGKAFRGFCANASRTRTGDDNCVLPVSGPYVEGHGRTDSSCPWHDLR